MGVCADRVVPDTNGALPSRSSWWGGSSLLASASSERSVSWSGCSQPDTGSMCGGGLVYRNHTLPSVVPCGPSVSTSSGPGYTIGSRIEVPTGGRHPSLCARQCRGSGWQGDSPDPCRAKSHAGHRRDALGKRCRGPCMGVSGQCASRNGGGNAPPHLLWGKACGRLRELGGVPTARRRACPRGHAFDSSALCLHRRGGALAWNAHPRFHGDDPAECGVAPPDLPLGLGERRRGRPLPCTVCSLQRRHHAYPLPVPCGPRRACSARGCFPICTGVRPHGGAPGRARCLLRVRGRVRRPSPPEPTWLS